MAKDWAGTAAGYEASFARLCRGALPFLVERMAATSGARGLDAGTGTGSAAAVMAAAGLQVIGVDQDPGMVELASELHPEVAFRTDALPRLSFADGAFDVTVANFVINHVPDPRAAVKELARVTRPGGMVLATIWPAAPVSPMNELWNGVVRESGAVAPSGQRLRAADDFERSVEGLTQLMAEAGMKSVAADLVGWDFVINADELWTAVESGIASIGATYKAQDHAGRKAMRAAYERITAHRPLTLPSLAVLGSGLVPAGA
ncbi:class I SAM-dependent methyltransferase [Microbacterium sp. 4R-513]|uniref:class I SAM-dependent methyltransferase n=1 Tax=Microbacterium sp. 4R-513 TaxID=2567934 RepID=UPI0013E178C1|nr:class I SAM-dependent methyltransferase [Microbacterium sp. 4R-513]QIG39117.1 class I SAM-dependent methyltransferase [Microbacterium sp. 4R-513]